MAVDGAFRMTLMALPVEEVATNWLTSVVMPRPDFRHVGRAGAGAVIAAGGIVHVLRVGGVAGEDAERELSGAKEGLELLEVHVRQTGRCAFVGEHRERRHANLGDAKGSARAGDGCRGLAHVRERELRRLRDGVAGLTLHSRSRLHRRPCRGSREQRSVMKNGLFVAFGTAMARMPSTEPLWETRSVMTPVTLGNVPLKVARSAELTAPAALLWTNV